MENDKLKQIINYLLRESCRPMDASLFHGKAGVMLSLYAYSKKYNIQLLRDFSDDLLNELYDMIQRGLPMGIEKGLAGIGLAITLLSNSRLICCNLNDTLCDIDELIMSYDPRRMSDMSLRGGALGVWIYIHERMKSDTPLISIDGIFINELTTTLKNNKVNLEYNPSWLLDELKEPEFNDTEYVGKQLGMDEGCSYFIIKDSYDSVCYSK